MADFCRRDFDRIRMAAQIVSSEDKENLRRQREEEHEAAMKAAQERRDEFSKAAKFHLGNEEGSAQPAEG